MKYFFLILCFFTFSQSVAQSPLINPRYNNSLWLVNLTYKPAVPAGSLALRYGFVNGAGVDVYFKSKKNYLWGINANLLFGRNVRDVNYVNIFKDNYGYIFADDGTPIYITASMRGSQFQLVFGRLLPIFIKKPQMALLVQGGAGFLQHKYLFTAPNSLQFSKTYAHGYDRLSNGLALSQEVGIQSMSLSRKINFNFGLEITEAYTKNRRFYDYATQGTDTKSYIDVLIALKIAWLLPIKTSDKDQPVYFK